MSTSPIRRLLRPTRPWVWLIALLLIYQIIGAFVLPQLLKHQLIKISAERLQLDTRVLSVQFDPYVFALHIRGLRITNADGSDLVAFDSLHLNLAPTSYLFSKKVEIQSFELDGLSALVELDQEGRSNIEKVVEVWAASSGPIEQQPQEAASSEMPEIQINNFELNRAQLSFIDNQLSSPFEIVLQEISFDLQDFSLDMDSSTSSSADLRAALELSSGGEIELAGEISFLPDLEAEIELGISDLSLTFLQSYIAETTQLELVEALVDLEASISSSLENTFAYEGSLAISELDFQYEQQSLLSWSNLDFPSNQFSLIDKSLSLSEIRLSEAFARIVVDEDGGTNIGEALATEPPQDIEPQAGLEEDLNPSVDENLEVSLEAESTSDSESATDFDISIGGIFIENSGMYFGDFSLPLPFATDISNLEGMVSTISNTSSEPADLNLAGQVGAFGIVNINGSLRPLNPKDLTKVELDFENIDMVDMAPYLIKFAGRTVDSGKLDLDLGYAVEDGQLEGSNNIVLRDFSLGERVESPEAMNLPLDLALSLLKNSDGVVDIDLPVSGDLNDPAFSFASILQTAFTNLITSIVSSPFRILGGLVGSEAPLDLIEFEAGSFELMPPQIEKLGALATALAERPELALDIPQVYSTDLDRPALQKAVLDQKLAELMADQAEGAETDTNLRTELLEQLFNQSITGTNLGAMRQEHSLGPEFDQLAYNSAIEELIIEAQPIDQTEFQNLAANRSKAIQKALLELNPNLTDRVLVLEGIEDLPESELETESRVAITLELEGV